METTEIQSLLETKFQGVRKDGLAVLAQSIALTYENEDDIKNLIARLDDTKAAAFVGNLRKDIDRETQNAIKTAETNLRKKYDFVEKGKQPEPQPTPQPTDTQNSGSDNTQILQALQNLQNQILGLQQKEVFNNRKADFDSLLKSYDKLPKTYLKGLESNFALQNFKDDTEFAEYKEQVTKSISEFQQELANSGLSNQPQPSFGSSGNTDEVSNAVKSFLADREKEDNAGIGKPLFEN